MSVINLFIWYFEEGCLIASFGYTWIGGEGVGGLIILLHVIQGLKLHLIQALMRLNFSLWRRNPKNYLLALI